MTDVNGENEAVEDGRLGEGGDPAEGARPGQGGEGGGPSVADHLTGGGDPVEGKP